MMIESGSSSNQDTHCRCGLVLQSEKNDMNAEMLEQLFRIEQYVELILQYLRVESISSDLLLQRYSLHKSIKMDAILIKY